MTNKTKERKANDSEDAKQKAISGYISSIIGCIIILFVGIGFIENVASFPDLQASTLQKGLNYLDKQFPATSAFTAIFKHVIEQANGVFTMSHTHMKQLFDSINMKDMGIAIDSAGKMGSRRNAYSSFMDIPYMAFGSTLSILLGFAGTMVSIGGAWLFGFLALGGALLGINVPSNVKKETVVSSLLSYLPFVMALGSALVTNNDKLYMSLTNAGADGVAGAMSAVAGKAFEYGWMTWLALLWGGWILMALYLTGSSTAYFLYNMYSVFIRPLVDGSISKNFKQHIFFFAGLIMYSIYSSIGLIVESADLPKWINTVSGTVLGLMYLMTVLVQ